MNIIRKTWNWLALTVWFHCGGWRRVQASNTDGFKMLSKDIIESRKLISELRSSQHDLELRVWELECHTPAETMEHAFRKLMKFQSRVEKLNAEWPNIEEVQADA